MPSAGDASSTSHFFKGYLTVGKSKPGGLTPYFSGGSPPSTTLTPSGATPTGGSATPSPTILVSVPPASSRVLQHQL